MCFLWLAAVNNCTNWLFARFIFGCKGRGRVVGNGQPIDGIFYMLRSERNKQVLDLKANQ